MEQSLDPMQLLKTRKSLLQNVWQALDSLSDEDSVALLTFWSSRGGGQTTFLKLVQEFLNVSHDVTVLGPWDFHNHPALEVGPAVLTAVGQVTAGKRVVLLDNIDTLLTPDNDSAFFDFERQVIHSLLERNDTLIVVTSQIELGLWHEYDVRLRHKSYYIPPLTLEEVTQVCEHWQIDASHAYTLTFGHPQVLNWLRVEPQLTAMEIASRADAYFLEALTVETAQFARVVSWLPIFNVAIIRRVLTLDTAVEDDGQDSLYGEYLDRIRELLSSGLLHWEIKMGAYRFADSSVRRLLARHLRDEYPAEQAHVQYIAAEYFQEEAQYASYLQSSFVSAVYHLAHIYAQEQPELTGERCRKWVQDHVDVWQGADWEAVIQAWQTGANDAGVREELQILLGHESFDQITQLLEATKSSVEMML